MREEVFRRAKKIRLLTLDADGVLTDGKLYLDGHGNEWQSFHIRDGHGIKLCLVAGIQVAIFSGRVSEAVRRRAEELGVKYLYQGQRDKVLCYEELKAELGIEDEEVCFVGDDLVDVPLLKRVGLPVVVADGVKEAKEVAFYVTEAPGGQGAVREVCELILKAQGKWEELLRSYGL